jgi:hypothetical protein
MPLIKARAHRVRTLRHIARLLEPNREVLFDYARFIQETPDYVLNQLLETVLAKDREFAMWRVEQNDRPRATSEAAPTKNVEPSPDASARPAPEVPGRERTR